MNNSAAQPKSKWGHQSDIAVDFLPADPASAVTLTPEQVNFFNENGYLHPISVFNAEEAVANREYIDELFAMMAAMDDGRDAYALNAYHYRCEGLYNLVMNETILDAVKDLIGPNVVCWNSQLFCKMGHDPKPINYHQDASYWELSPTRTVTVWLAIDDSDIANSCVKVLPGSHKGDLLSWSEVEGETVTVLKQKIDDVSSLGEPRHLELKAGQASIHSDLLVHGSEPNPGDRRRCGFVIRYCPPSVKPMVPSWKENAVLCCGEDTHGHWTYHDKPQGEDVDTWLEYYAKQREQA